MKAFKDKGLENVVLCPGSRSAPIALAAGGLAQFSALKLYTAIDERSAAFLALGLSSASGKATILITTSGTAVGNLLPAAIEADFSCLPIIFITADRPSRLKKCGANQTVNQEDFLKSVTRSALSGPGEGLHLFSFETVDSITSKAWDLAHELPGPVHLNLPIEEPLYPSISEQREVWDGWEPDGFNKITSFVKPVSKDLCSLSQESIELDVSSPGIVLVGPWRGSPEKIIGFRKALSSWYELTGWPIFADPLSGISVDQPGIIGHWELIISSGSELLKNKFQILRLGPLPSSRALEKWLTTSSGQHLLITEGDPRPLDPLKKAFQYSKGFETWYQQSNFSPSLNRGYSQGIVGELYKLLLRDNKIIDKWFSNNIELKGPVTEPALAYWLPRLIPPNVAVMISASSPIRDWTSYSGEKALSHRCIGFRGASGIDGTLSLAMGLSLKLGPMVLVCGDLAFLHDTNAWLFAQSNQPPLVVLLIDNEGGGIFSQVSNQEICKGEFRHLFAMPQLVNPIDLVTAYKIPSKDVLYLEELESNINWALSKTGPVVLHVSTNSYKDTFLRNNILDSIKRSIN